ncbi:MAG: FAD-binding oxidoreductase [Ginsengibacter sp.]
MTDNNKTDIEKIVKILSIVPVTHNVNRYRFEKPAGYQFVPGQATEVSINKAGWKNEKRPFTFTCLNDDPYLEFTIKSYNDHNGVTNELAKLKEGDELIIREVWGAIAYKGEGYFIAGGAGITPFISILRQLKKEKKINGNKLFFSNKTSKDIILKDELDDMLKTNVHYTITRERDALYDNRYIDEAFLKSEIADFKKQFYVCGPDKMVSDITGILKTLNAEPDSVVFER